MRPETRRAVSAYLNREILIGTDTGTGSNAYLPLDTLMETSVHVIGASGYGKSFWLRSLIDQFVAFNQPFSLIDPHGDLYGHALSALRRSSVKPNRIVLLDPSDDRYATAFNPLRAVADPGEASSLVLEACLKAWGASSFDQTPRMEGLLRGVFRMLAENNLTLLEAFDLLNVDRGDLRAALRVQVADPFVRADWLEFEKLPRQDELTVVESSRNRLRRFTQSIRIQQMISQSRNVLNLRDVMDQGQCLLVNLGGLASSPETQRLLGALVVNGFYHAAKSRNPTRRRDHFLIIDEVGQFASRDVANSLDENRKYGLHLVLAHQRLRQLEREDADVLSAVMTNAKIRVVFGGLERIEAERLGRELFTGHVRGDRVKHISYATKFRPVFDTFQVESESWSDTDGEVEGNAWSESSSTGTNESEGVAYGIDDDNRNGRHDEDDVVSRSQTSGSSRSANSSSGGSRSSSQSHASGGSKSLVPITRHEKFVEETGRQFVSIDEQFEEHVARVHGLAKREALIRVYNSPVVCIRTPDVAVERYRKPTDRFQTQLLETCRCVQPVAAVDAEIEERRQRIVQLIEGAVEPCLREPIRTFRE